MDDGYVGRNGAYSSSQWVQLARPVVAWETHNWIHTSMFFSGDLIASNQLKPIHLHTSIKINKDNFMKKSVRNNHRPTLSSAFQVSKKHLTSCQNPPRDGPTPIPELLRKWMFLDGAEGRCLVPKFKMEPKQGPLGKRHMTIFWGVTWCNLSWIFGLKFQSKVAVHTFQAGVEASRGKCLTDQQQQETHL